MVLSHNYDYFENNQGINVKVNVKGRMYNRFRHIVDKSGIIQVKDQDFLKDENTRWYSSLESKTPIIKVSELWLREKKETHAMAIKKTHQPKKTFTFDGSEKHPFEPPCICISSIKSSDFEFDCFGNNTIDYEKTKSQSFIRQNCRSILSRFTFDPYNSPRQTKFNMDDPDILCASSFQNFQRAIYKHNQDRLKYYNFVKTCDVPDAYSYSEMGYVQNDINHMRILECNAVPSSYVSFKKWDKFKKCMKKSTMYKLEQLFENKMVAWTAISEGRPASMILYRLCAKLKYINDEDIDINSSENLKQKNKDVIIPVFDIIYTEPRCQNSHSSSCGQRGPDWGSNFKHTIKLFKKRLTKERKNDRLQKL